MPKEKIEQRVAVVQQIMQRLGIGISKGGAGGADENSLKVHKKGQKWYENKEEKK